jgi:hypothetical protein
VTTAAAAAAASAAAQQEHMALQRGPCLVVCTAVVCTVAAWRARHVCTQPWLPQLTRHWRHSCCAGV